MLQWRMTLVYGLGAIAPVVTAVTGQLVVFSDLYPVRAEDSIAVPNRVSSPLSPLSPSQPLTQPDSNSFSLTTGAIAPEPQPSRSFTFPLTPEPPPPSVLPPIMPEPEPPAPGTVPAPNPPAVTLPSLRLEIKLGRRQVTLYQGEKPLKNYPIAVGRPGWETPTGTFQVRQMFRNPTWVHPLKQGITIAGGDPENPLGHYWIGFWTDGKNWIGFHGTDNQSSVGKPVSHGCIRMYNKDIEEMFQKVNLGTEVRVVK